MTYLEDIDISTKTANILRNRGFETADDVARILPRRYKDYRNIKNIKDCSNGETAVVEGVLNQVRQKKNKSKEYMTLSFTQKDGEHFTVMFFSRTYFYNYFFTNEHSTFIICGVVKFDQKYGYSIIEPDICTTKDLFKPQILPVMPKYSGVSDKKLKECIEECTHYITDPVGEDVCKKAKVPTLFQALKMLHDPETEEDIKVGRYRLIFGDMYEFAQKWDKINKAGAESPSVKCNTSEQMNRFILGLPYRLTSDQKAAVITMTETWKNDSRINVLLQGDVGSGKTVVAAAMAVLAVENGGQVVIMAPRTVLAKQHYDTFKELLSGTGITCEYLYSGMKAKDKRQAYEKIENKKVDIIVGTHSCISEDVKYKDLGLLIVDEEHLFGVNQKEALEKKADNGACVISMSATPIPRSIATTLYGSHKTIIEIKSMPAGRKPVITLAEDNRVLAFDRIQKETAAGNKVYVVCPAIDEDSELTSVEAVEKIYKKQFPRLNIKTMHGKLKSEEIAVITDSFKNGSTDILISTTVIEVGVDVRNATVIVIEQAERFGLASMHQLRGRVGRNDMQSYCYIETDDIYNQRVLTMTSTNDGFEIAEADLEQRGTGNLIGTKQSGINKYVEEMRKYPYIYEHAKKFI